MGANEGPFLATSRIIDVEAPLRACIVQLSVANAKISGSPPARPGTSEEGRSLLCSTPETAHAV